MIELRTVEVDHLLSIDSDNQVDINRLISGAWSWWLWEFLLLLSPLPSPLSPIWLRLTDLNVHSHHGNYHLLLVINYCFECRLFFNTRQ